MPCDTITQMEVATHKMRREYFLDTLISMDLDYREQGDIVFFGQRESYNFSTGQLKVQEGTMNSYKKAYSQTIVKKQALKMGWKLKSTSKTGNYIYVKR